MLYYYNKMSEKYNRIDLNSELLLREPVDTNDRAPFPVQQHVDSLQYLANEMADRGALSPASEQFAYLFARRHDAGYGSDIDIANTEIGRNIIGYALDAVESPAAPEQIANYLQTNRDNYLASRIIGHGVLSLVENTLYFQEKHRISSHKALGIASLLSAHHPGFPITMVAGFLQSEAHIPDNMRSAFFIDNNGENPELVRQQLTDLGAQLIGVSHADASQAVILGYALDRISAGRTPDNIIINEDGTTTIMGGEVIQKKYGLVAGDLRRDETQPGSIGLLYHTVNERLFLESTAALYAARSSPDQNIHYFISEESNRVMSATAEAQRDALAALQAHGFSGYFSELVNERYALLLRASETRDPNLAYALATYDAIL